MSVLIRDRLLEARELKARAEMEKRWDDADSHDERIGVLIEELADVVGWTRARVIAEQPLEDVECDA